jgi:hypothetical protein
MRDNGGEKTGGCVEKGTPKPALSPGELIAIGRYENALIAHLGGHDSVSMPKRWLCHYAAVCVRLSRRAFERADFVGLRLWGAEARATLHAIGLRREAREVGPGADAGFGALKRWAGGDAPPVPLAPVPAALDLCVETHALEADGAAESAGDAAEPTSATPPAAPAGDPEQLQNP